LVTGTLRLHVLDARVCPELPPETAEKSSKRKLVAFPSGEWTAEYVPGAQPSAAAAEPATTEAELTRRMNPE